eukprot:symbB.v1.2.035464.t1/scaffold4779.1/size34930/5
MARKKPLCCGCGFVPTVGLVVVNLGLVAVGVNFYIFHPRLRGAGSNTRSEGGARSPTVQEEEDVFHGSKF